MPTDDQKLDDNTVSAQAMSPRKQMLRRLQDELAPEREQWLERGAFFHQEDLRYLKFLIPEGGRVLELGSGNGQLLAALEPSFGVGVDFSGGMVAEAKRKFPHLTFVEGDIEDDKVLKSLPGPFDTILHCRHVGFPRRLPAPLGKSAQALLSRNTCNHRLLFAPLVSCLADWGDAEIAHAATSAECIVPGRHPFACRAGRF